MDDAANITEIIQGLRSEFMTSERIEAMFNRQEKQNEAIKEQLEAMAVSHSSLSQELNRLSVTAAQMVNLVKDQQELRQQQANQLQQLHHKVDSLDRTMDVVRTEIVKHDGEINGIKRTLHGSAEYADDNDSVMAILRSITNEQKAMHTAREVERREYREYVDAQTIPIRDELKVIREYIDILMSPIRFARWIANLLTPRQWKALLGLIIMLFITSFCTTNPDVQSALDVFIGSLAIGG